MSAVSQDVEALLAGLEVESIADLRHLVDRARLAEKGVTFEGHRWCQMQMLTASPIVSVMVIAEDIDLDERAEADVAGLAKLAVMRINSDRRAAT